MVKKIVLYVLLINSLIAVTYTHQEIIAEVISSNKENDESISYDHLDNLADQQSIDSIKPRPMPSWLKTVLFGIFIRFVTTAEFFKERWKKVKLSFSKKQ